MPTGVYKHKSNQLLQKGTKIMVGRRHSLKTKEIMSEKHKGKPSGMLYKKHSEKTRKKMSKTAKKVGVGKWMRNRNGKLSNHWKGGKSFEPYTTDWNITLRRAIKERDHYTCQLCGIEGNTVHHIDYDKQNSNPENLITLCISCHSQTNKNREYWKKYFKILIEERKK